MMSKDLLYTRTHTHKLIFNIYNAALLQSIGLARGEIWA